MEQKFQIENDNGTINVNFIGISLKEDIDVEKKRKFLSNLFNRDRLNSDIIRVIQYLRTVLRDFDEKTLNIELYNFGTHIDAKFKNKKVISLKKENISEPLLFKFYYDRETGVSFHTMVDKKRCENDIILNKNEVIKANIVNSIELIDSMNNIGKINLFNNEIILIEIYKLFTGKELNLMSENIYSELNSIFTILYLYGIELPNDNITMLNSGISHSTQVAFLTDKLLPYNDSLANLKKVKLYMETKNNISVIGYMTNEFMNKYNNNEILTYICQIAYVKKVCYYSNPTVDDIVSYKYVTCKDKNIVADILGLIDEIDMTLEDEEDMIAILNTINNKVKNKTYIKTK